jgi:hypothetical protein
MKKIFIALLVIVILIFSVCTWLLWFLGNAKTMTDKAILKHNVVFCDKISGGLGTEGIDMTEYYRDKCYQKYLRAYPERAVCDSLIRFEKDRCLDTLAAITGDASLCLEIEYNNYACVTGVAYSKKDINVCRILASSDEMHKCMDLYQTYSDRDAIEDVVSYCLTDKVNGDGVECLADFAYKKNDPVICNNLRTNDGRQKCLILYQSKVKLDSPR